MTFEYIEVFYNRILRHAKINNQIHNDFAKTYIEKLKKNVASSRYLPDYYIGSNSPNVIGKKIGRTNYSARPVY